MGMPISDMQTRPTSSAFTSFTQGQATSLPLQVRWSLLHAQEVSGSTTPRWHDAKKRGDPLYPGPLDPDDRTRSSGQPLEAVRANFELRPRLIAFGGGCWFKA